MSMHFQWMVPTLDVVSRDNVSVKVGVVVYLREPNVSMIVVADYLETNDKLLQTLMRSILGMYRLDKLLTDKEMLIGHMQQTLDAHTNVSGLNVSNVEIQHISLTESTANVVSRQNERARETAGYHA